MEFWQFLLDIVLLLLGCVVSGALASRLGQSPILGYLIAGMLLGGPSGFYLIDTQHEIELIAELGVSLLLFSLGLEFSFERLKSLGAGVLVSGFFQVGLTIVAAAGVLFLLGTSLPQAVAIGAVISVSSTACVLRVLSERAETDSAHGRNSIAILLVQDILIVPLAILVALLGKSGTPWEVLSALGTMVGMVAALALGLYLFINFLAVRAFAALNVEQNRELAVLFGVALGLGSTWLAHELELSPALGAFLAGMFLGSSPFAPQVRADISPLRIILLTLFFGSAGMVADPVWMIEHFPLVAASTAFVVLGKTIITTAILRSVSIPLSVSFATGLSLSQVGEFAFVLGTLGVESGVLDQHSYILIVSVAILSLFLTPKLMDYAPKIGMRFGGFFENRDPRSMEGEDGDDPHSPEIVVIGFGPAGQTAAAALVEYGRKLLVIDLNPSVKQRAEENGFSVVIGDAALFEVLEHAHLHDVRICIIAVPHHASAVQAIKHLRKLAPDSRIIVRARYAREMPALNDAGAHVIVGDEHQVGEELAMNARHLAKTDILELR